MEVIAYSSYYKGATWASFAYSQRTAAFVTILVYILMDNTITAEKVFTIFQYLYALQLTMSISFSRALQTYAETKVSVNRIEVRYTFYKTIQSQFTWFLISN